MKKCEIGVFWRAGQVGFVKRALNQLKIGVFYGVGGSVRCLHCVNGKHFRGRKNAVSSMNCLKLQFYSNVLNKFVFRHAVWFQLRSDIQQRSSLFETSCGAKLVIKFTQLLMIFMKCYKVSIEMSVLFSCRNWEISGFNDPIISSAKADLLSLCGKETSILIFRQVLEDCPASLCPYRLKFYRALAESSILFDKTLVWSLFFDIHFASKMLLRLFAMRSYILERFF